MSQASAASTAPFRILWQTPAEHVAATHVLAALEFCQQTQQTDPHTLTLDLKPLKPAHQELWLSPTPVHPGQQGLIRYRHNNEVLFGELLLDENDYTNLRQLSETAYRELNLFLHQQPFQHLLRTWHYFPQITGEQHGQERYQDFVVGRYQALADENANFETQLPAATAIGTHNPGYLIYFLAAKQPGQQIENPRQISAFHYPKQYSPKSPSFSRATYKDWGQEKHLYISGTASIVGHESLHHDSPTLQSREILNNLQSLLDHCHTQNLPMVKSIQELHFLKIYVKHPEHLSAIQHTLNDLIPEVEKHYFLGDVCREELLVEIEGMGVLQSQS